MDNVITVFEGVSQNELCIVASRATPRVFCSTSPNSAGPGAAMGCNGVPNLSGSNFTLIASGTPVFWPALFFYSGTPASLPMRVSLRCVGAIGSRLYRLGRFLVTS
jgi:hypothetical protein